MSGTVSVRPSLGAQAAADTTRTKDALTSMCEIILEVDLPIVRFSSVPRVFASGALRAYHLASAAISQVPTKQPLLALPDPYRLD